MTKHADWRANEYWYCTLLVIKKGDDSVGHDPKSIATYLRLQASRACRDARWEISARLGAAATAISEDARNNHPPRWDIAGRILAGEG